MEEGREDVEIDWRGEGNEDKEVRMNSIDIEYRLDRGQVR